MNTKEAIKLIEHVSWNAFGNYGYDNKREEMIALLKRGEKFEAIAECQKKQTEIIEQFFKEYKKKAESINEKIKMFIEHI